MKKVKKNSKNSKQWSVYFTETEKSYFFICLKSFIISKLDQQMSKSWKHCGARQTQTISKFDRLKNWVPDCVIAQFRTGFWQNLFRLKTIPRKKNQDFWFLPFLPSLPLWKMTKLQKSGNLKICIFAITFEKITT
jgi:hypothetical protein